MNTSDLKLKLLGTLCCLFMVGCDSSNDWNLQPQSNASTNLALSPPGFLLDSRIVNPDDLVLDLTANNISVSTVSNEQGVEQGVLNFDPGETVTIVAAWSASMNTLVPLASARRTIVVPDDPAGVSVIVEDTAFTTNFDSDGDLRSNIAELRADTDPLDGASPTTPAEMIPVRINFGIPTALQNADVATVSALSLSVLVNDRVFVVTRNGNVWSGEGSEVAGNDVFIEASFFSNATRDVLLDRYELRQLTDTNGLSLGLDTTAPTP